MFGDIVYIGYDCCLINCLFFYFFIVCIMEIYWWKKLIIINWINWFLMFVKMLMCELKVIVNGCWRFICGFVVVVFVNLWLWICVNWWCIIVIIIMIIILWMVVIGNCFVFIVMIMSIRSRLRLIVVILIFVWFVVVVLCIICLLCCKVWLRIRVSEWIIFFYC